MPIQNSFFNLVDTDSHYSSCFHNYSKYKDGITTKKLSQSLPLAQKIKQSYEVQNNLEETPNSL